MNQRPHGPRTGAPTDLAGSKFESADTPSCLIHQESDTVRAVLEELDDVVFLAIRGDSGALDQARKLWPTVLEQIGRDMVEESREQYLRYASDLARRFEEDAIRDPQKALAVIEIIELLMQE